MKAPKNKLFSSGAYEVEPMKSSGQPTGGAESAPEAQTKPVPFTPYDEEITLEKARLIRYGAWGGNPKGTKYLEGLCVERVYGNERGAISHQCNRKNGFGPHGLFCKQHDPEEQTRKRNARDAKYNARMAKLEAFLSDLGKSNPGWLGKMALQRYDIMNEAFYESERALQLARAVIAKLPSQRIIDRGPARHTPITLSLSLRSITIPQKMSNPIDSLEYTCPACQKTFGYYEGTSKCLRCDDLFDGSLANCSKCGSGNYETLCPHCEAVVETNDNY